MALEKAWVRLMRYPPAVLARVQADLKSEGFPPLEWYDVLLELDREGGRLKQTELGRKLLLARYNLTRLLDRLEREGLIARDDCSEDARCAVVRMTDAGRSLRERMWPAYAEAVRKHVGDRLTAEETAALGAILAKLG